MRQDLYTAEQVAELLDLHVRTVRKYVRDGSLKAVRIGKQYRISRQDLEGFIGRPLPGPAGSPRRHRHIDASTVVQVDAVSPHLADRVTNMLTAAARNPDNSDESLRLDTVYDVERGQLKVILSGGLGRTRSMLELVEKLTEEGT
jgi:excisionase family DNA binding protein